MPLSAKDKIELGIAGAILLIYVIAGVMGELEGTPTLVHALVAASAAAILGDNWLEARSP